MNEDVAVPHRRGGKKTVHAGLVGCGFSASFHYHAISKVYGTDVRVVGVYSRNQRAAQRFATDRGIRAFSTLEELLDAVETVHICTPPVTHEPFSIAALRHDKYVICEKPLTGYFGDGSPDFHGDRFPKQAALDAALASVERILDAEAGSRGRLLYAENWVYAPAIQKEREILQKTGGQILWIHGEESHSGSHSEEYAFWKFCGGGVLIGKGCHPLTAALYLKRVEGQTRLGRPIRPKTVTARTHAITRLPSFVDQGHIRCDYHDIDDFCMIHIEFDDGMIATVFASDIVLGGVHNWLEVCANNHRTICNINPNTAMMTYNPREEYFRDIYVVEKIGTKQGWAFTSPDEDWMTGYPQEMEAFYRTVAYGDPLDSDSRLAADAISTIYSAYVSAEQQGKAIAVRTFE